MGLNPITWRAERARSRKPEDVQRDNTRSVTARARLWNTISAHNSSLCLKKTFDICSGLAHRAELGSSIPRWVAQEQQRSLLTPIHTTV